MSEADKPMMITSRMLSDLVATPVGAVTMLYARMIAADLMDRAFAIDSLRQTATLLDREDGTFITQNFAEGLRYHAQALEDGEGPLPPPFQVIQGGKQD